MKVEQVVAASVVVSRGALPPVLCFRRRRWRCTRIDIRIAMLEGLRWLSCARKRGSTGWHHCSAPFRRNAQGYGQQVFLGVDDVDQPAQALRRVFAQPHMDVDAAAFVGHGPGPAQGADHFLDHGDVFPAAHRADDLGVGVGDRGVAFDGPAPPVGHGHRPVVEVEADVAGDCAEMLGEDLGCARAAETGGFQLNAKSLCFHGVYSFRASFPRGLPPRRPVFRPATHTSLCAAQIAR